MDSGTIKLTTAEKKRIKNEEFEKSRPNCYHWTDKDKDWRKEGGKIGTSNRWKRTARDVCLNAGHYYTKGNNDNYPGCGRCHCCKVYAEGVTKDIPKQQQKKVRNKKTKFPDCYTFNKKDLDWQREGGKKGTRFIRTKKDVCENAGHVFTDGKNTDFPNCGDCKCCILRKVMSPVSGTEDWTDDEELIRDDSRKKLTTEELRETKPESEDLESEDIESNISKNQDILNKLNKEIEKKKLILNSLNDEINKKKLELKRYDKEKFPESSVPFTERSVPFTERSVPFTERSVPFTESSPLEDTLSTETSIVPYIGNDLSSNTSRIPNIDFNYERLSIPRTLYKTDRTVSSRSLIPYQKFNPEEYFKSDSSYEPQFNSKVSQEKNKKKELYRELFGSDNDGSELSENTSGNESGNSSGNESGNSSGNESGNSSGNESGNSSGNESESSVDLDDERYAIDDEEDEEDDEY